MNTKRIKTLIRVGVLIPFLSTGIVHAVQVVSSVDAKVVDINDVFTFKVEALDADQSPRLDISPLLDDFTIVSGPSQHTNIQWVNGKMTSSRAITWTLSPRRSGSLTIPSLPVKVGKGTFATTPISITVSSGGSTVNQGPGRVSDEDVFVTAEVDKMDVVPGQQVTVTYKLQTKVNLSIDHIDFPDFVGFWSEELYTPQQVKFRDTQVKGVRYKVATLYKVALFPTKSGDLSIPTLSIKCNLEYKKRRRGRGIDPFYNDPFFNSFFTETVTRIYRTEEEIIKVRPYPDGQPADFNGAVGSFSIKTIVDTPQVMVNEAITLKVIVRGSGNISMFSLPKMEFPEGLEVFPPTSKVEKEPFRDELSGSMIWEYILIPRTAGEFTIPRIPLSFFDPQEGRWHRTGTRPVQLTILPGRLTDIAGSGLTKEEVTFLSKDIRYLRSAIPKWRTQGRKVIHPGVAGIYGLALALYFFPGFMARMTTNRLQVTELRTQRRALKHALRSLKRSNGDPFEQSSAAIYQYLRDKFSLASDNLDPYSAGHILQERLPSQMITELVDHLKTCDAGRFAPGYKESGSDLITATRNLLNRIDKNA